jgi:hypothetical protein
MDDPPSIITQNREILSMMSIQSINIDNYSFIAAQKHVETRKKLETFLYSFHHTWQWLMHNYWLFSHHTCYIELYTIITKYQNSNPHSELHYFYSHIFFLLYNLKLFERRKFSAIASKIFKQICLLAAAAASSWRNQFEIVYQTDDIFPFAASKV